MKIFRLLPSEYLSANEIEAATLAVTDETNVQHQQQIVWEPSTVLARAYMDQLGRTDGISEEHATAVDDALRRADQATAGNGAAVIADLETLATELDAAAEEAIWLDITRLESLGETLRGIATTLR